jgi:hypothetical protein
LDQYIPTRKWKNKFDLERDRALFVIERLMWQNNTEEEILRRLVINEHVSLRRFKNEGEDDRTELIFLSNPSMINSFKIYGDVVSLGFSDRVLCHYSPYGCKYTVGAFYAHD